MLNDKRRFPGYLLMLQYRLGTRGPPSWGSWLLRAVIIASLLVTIPALHGKGRQDDVLSRVDSLIAAKHYNEALSLLSDYTRGDPKKLELAQPRIRKIIAVREQYNTIAEALLDEMDKDTPDDARVLYLTNQLNDLDPERITETQDLIGQIREIFLFRSYQKRLEGILSQGERLIAQGEYTDALRTYAGGLDILQAEFFASGYGPAMENRARQGIYNINGNITAFTPVMNSLLAAVRDLESMANQGVEPQNLAAYRNAYNRVGTEIDRFIALRNIYAETNRTFRADLTQLRRSDPTIADRNFLAFASRLIAGRSEGARDGMLGVFDTLWNQTIPRTRDLLEAKALTVYTAAMNEANAGNYGRIEGRAETLAGYAALPADLEIRWNRYDQDARKATLFDQTVPDGEAENYLKYRALSDTSGYWRTLGQLGARYAALPPARDTLTLWRNGGNAEELIRTERTTTGTLRQVRQDAQALTNTIQQGTAGYRNLESRYVDSAALRYIDGISAAAASLAEKAAGRESGSAAMFYTISNEQMRNRIAERETQFRQGSQLLDGVQRGGYLAKNPTGAAEVLTRMETLLEADRQAMQALITQYNEESPENIAGAELSRLRTEALAIQTRQENLRSQARNLAVLARSQSEQAGNLRRDGDRFFTEAQTALARADFDTARNRITQAGNAYDQSLSLEDDEATRNKRDVAVPNLDAQIAIRLNEDVIRRVEELVGQIRESYFGNDFDRAERLITQAQNTWRLTQTIDNPDIAYWQGMIRAGLRSGRTIPATAPLYAEMSQLLSEARKNYEEGQVLLASSRNEGMNRLTAARQNVEKVKLVYPMNEEASLLDLRIEQQMDPAAFSTAFAEKVRIAIEGTRRGNNRIQFLNDLLNLRAINPQYNLRTINPQYTSWESVITQAEIDAGLRPPPPDPRAIAEAQSIVDRNRGIVTSRNQDRIEEARNELSRALGLDPNNAEARNLFNEASRILVAGRTVLDSEAERLFQQASQAIAQNNGVRALQLITQIYNRNPNYRYINRMITLENRARSIL